MLAGGEAVSTKTQPKRKPRQSRVFWLAREPKTEYEWVYLQKPKALVDGDGMWSIVDLVGHNRTPIGLKPGECVCVRIVEVVK